MSLQFLKSSNKENTCYFEC